MAYKQPSTGPFKMMGSSPVANDNFSKNKKPANFNTKGGKTTTPGYSTTKGANKGLPKNFNTQGGKTTTPGYNTTKAANKGLPKGFNTTGTSKAGKFAKVAKKVVGKAGKFLGGKTLGVAGMLMATSSKADQPTEGKGKREYEGGKINFTKK